jgi:hypothetical protein
MVNKMTNEEYEAIADSNYMLGREVGLEEAVRFLSDEAKRQFGLNNDENAHNLRSLSGLLNNKVIEVREQRAEKYPK